MIPRRARGTIQCLNKARTFSSTAPAASIARKPSTSNPQDASKRAQSTSTATQTERARPAPAFNREDPQRSFKDVQPLKPYKRPDLDYSFVGMTGGEIIHEMLMRQNVKHVCESRHLSYFPLSSTITCIAIDTNACVKSAIPVVPSFLSSTPS